jgi:LysM repeat protein
MAAGVLLTGLLWAGLFFGLGQALAATHTVTPGESLWSIGQKYRVDSGTIQSANGLKDSSIVPGQKLYIPETSGEGSYTVRPGDNLYGIAGRYGLTVKQLMDYNGLQGTLIQPGQTLRIAGMSSGEGVSRGGVNRNATGYVNSSEFDTLARIITAEADNQSHEAKVAVGAVILNRVESPLFPDTIKGVVYQVDAGGRYQFEPVLNGWINRPPSQSAINAAREALSGADPTNGALFFWESWVKSSYLNARPVAKVIGAFTFTY